MTKSVFTFLAAGVLAGATMLGGTRMFAQTSSLPKATASTFDTVEAPVLKVFSAKQKGHKFIAYLVKWKDFEVIVSDPLGRSNYQDGDTIRFMAQRVSLPNASSLNFTLLPDLAGLKRDTARRTASPTEQKRLMQIVGGELDAAKTETERFYALNRAAKNALQAGKTEGAQKLAEELMRLAETHKNDWNYGNAIQDANQVLGRIALAKGDIAEAKKRLLASADSKGSPQMNSFGPNMQLAKELLAVNEKQVVLKYFGQCRTFWKSGADRLAAWTESVENGMAPEFGANLDL